MIKSNYSFNVFTKISKEDRHNWYLYIDAVYKSNPKITNQGAEVLSKLLGVKNQGGFRYLGKTSAPKLVVLYTTGEDVYWKDELDSSAGLLVYYGDNKNPGTDIHKTNLHGNEILKYMFSLASDKNIINRKKIPPVLVFKKEQGRNVKYLGLAIPGVKDRPSKEWLTALWGQNKVGDRFQNYKALFTILSPSGGSEGDQTDAINLAWLNDIEEGNAFESRYAPKEWKNFIQDKRYLALIAKKEKFSRTKDEQLPNKLIQKEMLSKLQKYFVSKDKGYSFELFATDLVQSMDKKVINLSVTRPYKDGGFDAEGYYKIFSDVENNIYVDFFLQAKCYASKYAVKTGDTSRLISRIKNRQFGIMITTSYVAKQAYEEILADKHPIVIISGKDIIEFLFNELEIRDIHSLEEWLKKRY